MRRNCILAPQTNPHPSQNLILGSCTLGENERRADQKSLSSIVLQRTYHPEFAGIKRNPNSKGPEPTDRAAKGVSTEKDPPKKIPNGGTIGGTEKNGIEDDVLWCMNGQGSKANGPGVGPTFLKRRRNKTSSRRRRTRLGRREVYPCRSE